MWVWVWVEGSGFGERAPHTPKYLDQFLMVLLVNFTTRLAFVRQVNQGVATICILTEELQTLLNILINS